MGDDEGFWQKVKFEELPDYCSYCWHVGYSEIVCHVKHPELKVVDKEKHVGEIVQHNMPYEEGFIGVGKGCSPKIYWVKEKEMVSNGNGKEIVGVNHLHRKGSKIVRGGEDLGSKEKEDVLVSKEREMSSCSKERDGFTDVEKQGDRLRNDEGDVARAELVDKVFVEHSVKPNVLVDPDARALVMFQGFSQ